MQFGKVTITAFIFFLSTFTLYSQPQNTVIKTDYYDLKETAVAVNPNNANVIMAAWNRWGKYSINGQLLYGLKPDYGFSTNGGSTWTTGSLPNIPSSNPQEPYELGFDPSCVFDDNNNAYYNYVMKKKGASLGPIFISKTTNYGTNWQEYQVSTLTSGQDKCYMTIDNTGGSYDGRIYIAWVDLSSWSSARLMFRYTTSLSPVSFGSELELEAKTGSFSEQSLLSHLFLSPIVTYDVLQAPTPVVAPNGDVYVSWIDIDE